jgi:hypothetical protein
MTRAIAFTAGIWVALAYAPYTVPGQIMLKTIPAPLVSTASLRGDREPGSLSASGTLCASRVGPSKPVQPAPRFEMDPELALAWPLDGVEARNARRVAGQVPDGFLDHHGEYRFDIFAALKDAHVDRGVRRPARGQPSRGGYRWVERSKA